MTRVRPTNSRLAHASAQGMADAKALEGIMSRAVNGVPAEADRPMLVAIAKRLPAPVRDQVRAVLADVGEAI